MPLSPSNQYNYTLTLADLLTEALARCGILSSQIEVIHLIEGRRSMNLMFQDWSANRNGPLLATIDQVSLGLVPTQASYTLPASTIQVLDVYLRSYTPNTTYTTIGSALTPILNAGSPVLTQSGEPMVVAPGSGTLSCTAGSQYITVTWAGHGLSPGAPVFFNTPSSVGGITLPIFCVVNNVLDINTFQVLATTAASVTENLMGATPLVATTSGSAVVTVYLPGHGLAVGSSFAAQVAVSVGGLTIPIGTYTVATVPNSYSFTFNPALGNASSTNATFENSGQLQVTSQLPNNDPIDIIMSPMSRTEYVSIPDKFLQGRPTSFWYDRLASPSINVWLVPPTYSQGNVYFGMTVYRMRQIQDANPVGGQTSELPLRWMEAAAAALAARCAEKFAPAMYVAKMAAAEAAWNRAAIEDVEEVPLYLTPALQGYFR